MRWSFVLITSFVLLHTARTAEAQERYYLSQIASGRFDSGSYRTTFVLFNNTDRNCEAVLALTDNSGAPLPVTITGLSTGSVFRIFVRSGGTQLLQTSGEGPVVVGAATVTTTEKIGVSAIFTIYDSGGNYVTEAGVGDSELLTEFVLPVDTTGQFNTGLALFNSGDALMNVTFTLRDIDGQVAGQTARALEGKAHLASFVAGATELFPSLGAFQGTLLVQSSIPVAALGLRQNLAPLSFTSLPVVPTSFNRLTQVLAQVVDGAFAEGSYKTSFLLFNFGTRAADITLSLTRDDGSPFIVTIPGRGTGSTFSVGLAAGASAFLQTDGSGDLAQGAATITSNVPVGASAIFTVFDRGGTFGTEAGVGNSPVLTEMTLPVDLSGNFDTGVAFFNPSDSAVTISLKLLDGSGNLFDPGTTIELGARAHSARFVSQIFPGTPNFRGSMTISVPNGVAALTLRQNLPPLSYTTLPVAAGFALGNPLEAPLLGKSRSGVSATGDVIINETLTHGFRLTGMLLGTGRAGSVTARSEDGTVFEGDIDGDTRRYIISVPAGSYTLEVCYQPVTGATWGTLTSSYLDPTPVALTADLTHHITLPSPELFETSGTVSGLANLPELTDTRVVLTSDDNSTEGSFLLRSDGTYRGFLPNGNYKASVIVPLIVFSQFRNESLALYNLASATVANGPTSLGLSIPPTTKVTGLVRANWLSTFIPNTTVSALDRARPPVSETSCVLPPAVSTAQADPGFGDYQMVLARDRTYSMGISLPFYAGSRRLGTVVYPLNPDTLIPTGDTLYNFNLPDMPGLVVISGRITDNEGLGIGGVGVAAVTHAVTGAPNLRFAASTSTDTQGNYSLTVPSGTGYDLRLVPVIPRPSGGGGEDSGGEQPR